MAKMPWMKFYPSDWLSDPRVSACDARTRGIWMDLICHIHELDEGGSITGSVDELARLARCTASEMQQAIQVIHRQRVAQIEHRNALVTLTCRRMERESKTREINAERQRRARGKSGGHAPVTPLSRGRGQKSEVRSTPHSPPSGGAEGEKPMRKRRRARVVALERPAADPDTWADRACTACDWKGTASFERTEGVCPMCGKPTQANPNLREVRQ